MNRRGKIGGFTLVEIMVAIVIGLFLTAGMIQMYVSYKQSYRFNEALARIQENGRFALESISRDLRTAYFFGCSRGTNANEVAPGNYCFDLAASACGSGSCLPATTPGVEGTDGTRDIVFIRGAGRTSINVGSTSTATSLNVTTDATQVLNTNDLALVSNCSRADLFQVTTVSTTTVTPNNGLSIDYDTDALVYPWQEVEYFIQTSFGESTLFRRANQCSGGTAKALAEGIENLQLSYGEDTDGDGTANRYVNATTMNSNGDWDQVVAVRVNLTLASSQLAGNLTMSTTVALRNRTP